MPPVQSVTTSHQWATWLVHLVVKMKLRPVLGPFKSLSAVSMRLLPCLIHSSDCGQYDIMSPVCVIVRHSSYFGQHETSPMSDTQLWFTSAWCSLSGVSVLFPVCGQHGALYAPHTALVKINLMSPVCWKPVPLPFLSVWIPRVQGSANYVFFISCSFKFVVLSRIQRLKEKKPINNSQIIVLLVVNFVLFCAFYWTLNRIWLGF